MKSQKSSILNKLRNNEHFDWDNNESPNQNVSVFYSSENPLEDFIQKLEQVKGESFTYKNKDELYSILTSIIKENSTKQVFCKITEIKGFLNNRVELTSIPNEEMSITECEFLIPSSGSVIVSSITGPGRSAYIVPKINVIITSKNQFCRDIKEMFIKIKDKYQQMPSWMSIITGPSRTADIEKTLVLGAHGSQKLIVLIDVG